jgi:hypothetical protein
VGPASSTDNAIARFDQATGKLIQNSANAILQDSGAVSFADCAIYGTNAAGNTFVGAGTVNTSTLSQNSATSCVSVGKNAGKSITTGSDSNVFVGVDAGQAMTVGDTSTFVGAGAGYSQTGNVSGNTAVGYFALYTNASGTNCVAVGNSAGRSSTGSSQTMVGHSAGYYVTGGNSTFVGASAGFGVSGSSTGADNVGIGQGSLGVFTTGSQNSGCGTSTLTLITTGGANSAFGYNSGNLTIAGADFNTFSNCTFLGANTRVSGSNQVQIGDSATTAYAYGAVQDRSDERDKSEIRNCELGLNFILELSPKQWKWDLREDYVSRDPKTGKTFKRAKDGSRKRKRFHSGFLAQDIDRACRKLEVDFAGLQWHGKNGGDDVWSLGYQELLAPMVGAIKELAARNAELSARIDKLERK